jgi:hypothetical protein
MAPQPIGRSNSRLERLKVVGAMPVHAGARGAAQPAEIVEATTDVAAARPGTGRRLRGGPTCPVA